MGQRLVITVQKNEKELAKIYYHWSAYTMSALYEAKELIEYLKDDYKSERDLQLDLIRYVEGKGGCIYGGENSKEFIKIQKMFPDKNFKPDGSRSNGLIALSQEGMDDMQSWSEGDLYVNLTTNKIINSVLHYYDCVEELNEWYEESWEFDEITELKNDIEVIPFSNLDNVLEELDNGEWNYVYRYKDDIYTMIG